MKHPLEGMHFFAAQIPVLYKSFFQHMNPPLIEVINLKNKKWIESHWQTNSKMIGGESRILVTMTVLPVTRSLSWCTSCFLSDGVGSDWGASTQPSTNQHPFLWCVPQESLPGCVYIQQWVVCFSVCEETFGNVVNTETQLWESKPLLSSN